MVHDETNLLRENKSTIKNNTETLPEASNDSGLEIRMKHQEDSTGPCAHTQSPDCREKYIT
jgi:hypothetical protein